MLKKDRFIGGGKIFFTPENGKRFEFAELKKASIKIESTTKEAYDNSSSMKKQVAVVATEVKASIDFAAQKFTKDARLIAQLGKSQEKTFEIGDTLPNGAAATKKVVLDAIQAGKQPLIKGKLEFIGDTDGDKQPIIIMDSVTIKPNGDIALISEDFAELGFSGQILADDNGVFYNEYLMDVGA